MPFVRRPGWDQAGLGPRMDDGSKSRARPDRGFQSDRAGDDHLQGCARPATSIQEQVQR